MEENDEVLRCVKCGAVLAPDETDENGELCIDCAYDASICVHCDGTGEGMYDGSRCTRCGGSGREKRKCDE